MPKIIENLENMLIEEAWKQIKEAGYSAMTIRSAAKGCGVGIGTVYNYFRSKDELLATYMLMDWNHCMDAIRESSRVSLKPEPVVRCIHDQLRQFSRLHQSIFRDETAQ